MAACSIGLHDRSLRSLGVRLGGLKASNSSWKSWGYLRGLGQPFM